MPPNILLYDSRSFVEGEDQVQLHVGCSADGSELVIWSDEEKEHGRQLKRLFITEDGEEAAESFNKHLSLLAERGFGISEEEKIDAVLIERNRPTEYRA